MSYSSPSHPHTNRLGPHPDSIPYCRCLQASLRQLAAQTIPKMIAQPCKCCGTFKTTALLYKVRTSCSLGRAQRNCICKTRWARQHIGTRLTPQGWGNLWPSNWVSGRQHIPQGISSVMPTLNFHPWEILPATCKMSSIYLAKSWQVTSESLTGIYIKGRPRLPLWTFQDACNVEVDNSKALSWLLSFCRIQPIYYSSSWHVI